MKRFGIRQRFILVIFPLFVVLFGAIAAVQVRRTAATEQANLNQQSTSFATLATKPISDTFILYKDSGTVRIKQQLAQYLDLNPDVVGVSIVDTSGRTLFSDGRVSAATPVQASSFDPVYVRSQGVIATIISPVVEDYGVHRYAIVYHISDQRLVQNLQHTVALIVLLSLVVFLLAIAATYWLINRYFLSPVRTISARALKISEGNLEDQIELKRNDELGDLAQAVNTMANSLKADIVKLQEADRLKTEFITISSHNLRTPLTVIKGELEMMQEMGVPAQLNHMLTDLSASASHLNTFIEDLLAISSIESGKLGAADMKPAPLKDLLERIAGEYEQMARQKKLAWKVDIQLGDEQVVMSDHLLKMAFVNLLENAFKFTKEGSVTLRAQVESGQAVVEVSDTGIGIAEEEIPKLFTKFHRGSGVLEYDYEGTGIGLYLTKLIINDHHGTVSVASAEGKGTTFTIVLPLAA